MVPIPLRANNDVGAMAGEQSQILALRRGISEAAVRCDIAARLLLAVLARALPLEYHGWPSLSRSVASLLALVSAVA